MINKEKGETNEEKRKKTCSQKSFSKFKIPDKWRDVFEKLQKDKLETLDINNAGIVPPYWP